MKKIIITFSILFLIIVGAFFVYKYNFSRPDNFGERPNFNLDDTVKNDTIYFFDSTSNIDEIRNYCEENRPNCGFYCMEINPNHEICSQMQKPGVQPK